jgi:hypothetical protein
LRILLRFDLLYFILTKNSLTFDLFLFLYSSAFRSSQLYIEPNNEHLTLIFIAIRESCEIASLFLGALGRGALLLSEKDCLLKERELGAQSLLENLGHGYHTLDKEAVTLDGDSCSSLKFA